MIIQQLSTSAESFEQQFAQLLHWDMHTDSELDQRVAAILGQVRQRGDEAVLELTNELDRRNDGPSRFRAQCGDVASRMASGAAAASGRSATCGRAHSYFPRAAVGVVVVFSG